MPLSVLRDALLSRRVAAPADVVYKAKKIRHPIKGLKILATKLIPAATLTPLLDNHASQL